MDCVAIYFSSAEEESSGDEEESSGDEMEFNVPMEMKLLRDRNNIMDIPSNMFVKAFRLTKDAFKYVLQKIEPDLPVRRRSTSISNYIKLGTTLGFLAQGGHQLSIAGDYFVPMTQKTFSRILNEVLTAIEDKLCPVWITLQMTDKEKLATKTFFYNNYKLPNVIGAIGGTHINITRPTNDESYFLNWKQKYSINAMVICDEKMRIRSIDGTNGGSTDNAFIWAKSSEREYFQNLHDNGEKCVLLGDSTYPLEPWLMTPYRTTSDRQKIKYNNNHSQAQSIIETTFRLLKSRFRCLLSELHYAPEKAVKILNVYCALHNICIAYKVPHTEEEEDDNQDSEISDVFESLEISDETSLQNKAKAIRDVIKNSL